MVDLEGTPAQIAPDATADKHPPFPIPIAPAGGEIRKGIELSENDVRDAFGKPGDSAVGLVETAFKNNEYDTSAQAREKFAKDHSVSIDHESVNLEMTRREEVKVALNVVQMAINGTPIGDSIGVFQVMGPGGKPTKNIIRAHQAVGPIIEELRRMSLEIVPPIENKEPELTARAIRAQELLAILEPRLVPIQVKGGVEYFISPDLYNAEREKRRASALAAAQAVEQAFIEGAGNDSEANFLFSNLAMYHDKLVAGVGDPELLTAIVTNLSRECARIHVSEAGFADNPILTAALQDLEANVNFYAQNDNNPLIKLAEDTLAGLGVPEDKVSLITQQINDGKIRMGELFTFLSGLKSQDPKAISSAITQASGGVLKKEEARLARWMFENGHLETVTTKFSRSMGFKPDDLKDIRKFLKANIQTFTKNAFPPNHVITSEDIAAVKSLTSLTDEQIIAAMKNQRGINGSWIMMLVMAIPMLQGVLGAGVGAGEREES